MKHTIATLKKYDLKQFSKEDLFTLECKLCLHNANLRAIVHSMGGKIGSVPLRSDVGDDALKVAASVKNQLAHTDALMAELGGAADVAPNFEFSAGLKPGGEQTRSAGAENRRPGASAKSGQTLTEKVLAMRGVKTLDELNAKMQGEPVKLEDDDKKKDDDEKEDDKDKDDGDENNDSKREKEADEQRIKPNKNGGGDDDDDEDDEKRDDGDGDPKRDKETEPARTSLTGKVLKARGVKTLAELNALPPRNIGD